MQVFIFNPKTTYKNNYEYVNKKLKTRTKQILMTIYSCKKCSFSTNNLCNFKFHEKTKKHNIQSATSFHCEKCNKPFKTFSGQWKHTKGCVIIPKIYCEETKNNDEQTLILKQMAEKYNENIVKINKILSKKGVTTTELKKNINLQYLNTYCKDTIDINIFMDAIIFSKVYFKCLFMIGFIPIKLAVLYEIYNSYGETEKPFYFVKNNEQYGTIYIKYDGIWIEETPKKHPILNRLIIELNCREMDCWIKIFKLNIEETPSSSSFLSNLCDTNKLKEKAESIVYSDNFCGLVKSNHKINYVLINKLLEKIKVTKLPHKHFDNEGNIVDYSLV